MATSTDTRYASQPVREYWGMVKDLDNSLKLELIALLAESMKPSAGKAHTPESEGHQPKPYTMEEINTMLDAAEAEMTAGRGIPDEEVWRELEKDLAEDDAEEEEGQRIGSYIEEYQHKAV